MSPWGDAAPPNHSATPHRRRHPWAGLILSCMSLQGHLRGFHDVAIDMAETAFQRARTWQSDIDVGHLDLRKTRLVIVVSFRA
jgi:hypothetical protein